MAMATAKYMIFVVLFLGTSTWLSESVVRRITFNSNFTVLYEVRANASIVFVIEAKTRGWVGIGFSYKNESAVYDSADYFLGYAQNGYRGAGGDYFIRANATSQRLPTRDSTQNWFFVNATETSSDSGRTRTTRVASRRNLISTDKRQDLDITNSTLNLIFMYNFDSDDLKRAPSQTGSVRVKLNLSRGTGGGGGGGGLPGLPGGGGNAGVSAISAGIATLLLTLTASLLKVWE